MQTPTRQTKTIRWRVFSTVELNPGQMRKLSRQMHTVSRAREKNRGGAGAGAKVGAGAGREEEDEEGVETEVNGGLMLILGTRD